MKTTVIVIATILTLGMVILAWQGPTPSKTVMQRQIKVPTLSSLAVTGKAAFDANCVQCHGADARGTDSGPPLVHDIYNPGHHGDGAFFLAAKRGARQHHWNFGDMPRQPQVSETEMTAIIRYVRELQEANGIVYRAHRM